MLKSWGNEFTWANAWNSHLRLTLISSLFSTKREVFARYLSISLPEIKIVQTTAMIVASVYDWADCVLVDFTVIRAHGKERSSWISLSSSLSSAINHFHSCFMRWDHMSYNFDVLGCVMFSHFNESCSRNFLYNKATSILNMFADRSY